MLFYCEENAKLLTLKDGGISMYHPLYIQKLSILFARSVCYFFLPEKANISLHGINRFIYNKVAAFYLTQ
jgi:hypothetical protein